jgi:hypothetical protein
MISPKLLDFSPFFFLISSPLGTADFLMLLEPSGDGYSLLCSKKQPPRHSASFDTLCGLLKKKFVSTLIRGSANFLEDKRSNKIETIQYFTKCFFRN